MPESEGGFVPPEATLSTTKIDSSGDIVDQNQKHESKLGRKVSGWVALAKHGYRVWRAGEHKPPEPGQVRRTLEERRDRIKQGVPFEVSPLPSKETTPTTDK